MRTVAFAMLAALAGCAADASTEPTAPDQLRGDDKADGGGPLWAGLTSITIERYASDPCNNGRTPLGDEPVVYDEWARERAAIRNVCFEVWSPGVTDWDNPDFWKQLDVQVHYRFGDTGAEHTAYVNSIDRRGNNRRYAWALDYALDPTVHAPSLPEIQMPFTVLAADSGYATVQADMQFWFTVNGRVLESASGHPFTIRYTGYVRYGQLTPDPNGRVLYDLVTCDGARFGSGAGYFVADVRDPAAIAQLWDSSLLYGANAGGSAQIFEVTYPEEHPVAGEALPGFRDDAGVWITPSGSTMKVELDAYDRSAGATRRLTATFTGCTSATTTN
jgi:hypothetical protein